METEDIRFLLSIEGTPTGGIFSFEAEEEDGYDSALLFAAVADAKAKGFEGVLIACAKLKQEDETAFEAMGYFIKQTGWRTLQWDEIYFSEEGLVKSAISSFQNLFGGIQSLAHAIVG